MVMQNSPAQMDSPRDQGGLAQPTPTGQLIDPTHALSPEQTLGVVHSNPPFKECEHASRGRDPLGMGELTFPRFNKELLTLRLTQNLEVSPQILKLMQGAKGLIQKVKSVGGRHSEPLLLEQSGGEEPRREMPPAPIYEEDPQEFSLQELPEKETRKHDRESISSEEGSEIVPPSKTMHDEGFSPLQEDTPHFSELGEGKRNPAAVDIAESSPGASSNPA